MVEMAKMKAITQEPRPIHPLPESRYPIDAMSCRNLRQRAQIRSMRADSALVERTARFKAALGLLLNTEREERASLMQWRSSRRRHFFPAKA
jgi:hypothetical protein